MFRLYLLLLPILMLTPQRSALQTNCPTFFGRWKELRCAETGNMCFVSKTGSLIVMANGTGELNCGYNVPDKALFVCIANISKLRHLEMMNCAFKNFVIRDFLSFHTPSTLRLQYSDERYVPLIVEIYGIPSLESVEILGSRTDPLFEASFNNLPTLHRLSVENYNFTTFSEEPFRQLNNIKQIEIKNGMLEILPEDIFSGLKFLARLDLSYNRIAEIKLNTFRDLRSLELVNLSGNQIEEISEPVFSGLNNLRCLLLANNNLSTMPNYDWFKHHLKVLNLSDNGITTVNLPTYTKEKTTVILERNSITTIILDYTLRYNLSPLYSIVHNPLVCDCRMEDFLNFLHTELQKTLWVFTYASINSKCEEPKEHISLKDVCSTDACDLCSTVYRASKTYTEPGMMLLSICVFFVLLSLCSSLVFLYFNRAAILPVLYHWNVYCACCDRRLPKDEKTYDSFLCYYVEDTMHAKEIQNRFKEKKFLVCEVKKEGSPNFTDKDAIRDALMNCRTSTLLLSSIMVMTSWFRDEYLEVHNRMPSQYVKTVIPIFIDEFRRLNINHGDMIKLLLVKRGMIWEEKFFWKKLEYYFRTPKK